MSNVYTRNRNATGKEYYDIATQLYMEFRRFKDQGLLGQEQITCAHNSYRGYILKDYNSHKTVRSMDKLFHELFGYNTKINRKEKF